MYISGRAVVKNKLILSSIHKYEHTRTRTRTPPNLLESFLESSSSHVRFFSILDS